MPSINIWRFSMPVKSSSRCSSRPGWMQASMYRTADTPQQVNQRIAIGREIAARPCSQLAIVPRFTPIRAANFCWLRPERVRAISNALAVLNKYSSIILTPSTKLYKTAGLDKPKNGKSCYGEPTAACVITVPSKKQSNRR